MVAAIACALAPNEYVLTGARFVMGPGIDLPVAMAFSANSRGSKVPATRRPAWRCGAQRGTRRSAFHICWYSFYAVLPESHSDWLWRIILGFGAIPALVIIAIRSRYMSESPVWPPTG